MKDRLEEIRQQLGADRVLDPPGSLPQPAARLDPAGPVRPYEVEVAAERLCLDSTSHRSLHRRCGGDPEAMVARILEIVATRGKMHNPDTDSGGILMGTVAAVGERLGSPPAVGAAIATLGSLTLTPLRLEAVTGLDPDSPQVEVEGTAYVFERAPWAELPDDLPTTTALELFDVCAAASQVRELIPPGGTVCVLGAGHAGKLVLASGRAEMDGGTLVAIDVDPAAVELVTDVGLCDIGVAADLRDPLAALEAVRDAGVTRRSDGGRGQRDRLRAHGDPAHGRRRDSALLLDGDGVLRGRAGRRRDRLERTHADRQRLPARPRRVRARARARVRAAAPRARALGGRTGLNAGHTVQMRWRDLDGLGHVNHTVVLTYLEEGRDAFLKACGISRDEYVVGRCSVEFKGEIDPAFEAVRVECAVSELGTKSVTTSERIVDSAGDAIVEARFGIVLWDPARRTSRAITDEERAALAGSGERG